MLRTSIILSYHAHSNHVKVTKNGATYDINYSTTVYGYNAISALLTLEQASCSASSNDVGSAIGSYTIQLVWNGQTPTEPGSRSMARPRSMAPSVSQVTS